MFQSKIKIIYQLPPAFSYFALFLAKSESFVSLVLIPLYSLYKDKCPENFSILNLILKYRAIRGESYRLTRKGSMINKKPWFLIPNLPTSQISTEAIKGSQEKWQTKSVSTNDKFEQ